MLDMHIVRSCVLSDYVCCHILSQLHTLQFAGDYKVELHKTSISITSSVKLHIPINVISLGYWAYQVIAIDVTPFELHIEIGKCISMALSSINIKPFSP